MNSGGIISITSNRDEQTNRPAAIPPKRYVVGTKELFYPKDALAGGTWFVMDGQSRVIVLLNGAGKKHNPAPPYRKSRGLIPLELLENDVIMQFWEHIDLENIEPFTLVIYENGRLFTAEWNGTDKSLKELDSTGSYVWSSVTLYEETVRVERAAWFYEYINEKVTILPEDMLHFHRFGKSYDAENGLVINRNEEVKTVSITQAVIYKDRSEMTYSDLLTEKIKKEAFMVM